MLDLAPVTVPALFVLGALASRFVRGEVVSRLALLAFAGALGALLLLIAPGPGLSSRLGFHYDGVGAAMLTLVSFIGWIVLRYSVTALAGEKRQAAFLGWMSATLAAVCSLTLAGSLITFIASFIASSLCLHQLLVFYPERAAAERAARKKFIVSRLADLALIAAGFLLWRAYGTFDIQTMAEAARQGVTPEGVKAAALLLSLTAMLKSAQFPLHGWLTEVMETPTPVSALLHAGVVNAGGFLLIRFADIVTLSPLAMTLLMAVGGLTCLIAGLAMLTHSAVKTALAWSTVAQMGFMILQCGLGLFPIALLHILAHSLYKAHAFLTSGSAVEKVKAARAMGQPKPVPLAHLGLTMLAALTLLVLAAMAFGALERPLQELALASVLLFGLAGLMAAAGRRPMLAVFIAVPVALAYFLFQDLAYRLMAGSLPAPVLLTGVQSVLLALIVAGFALTALAQMTLDRWFYHPLAIRARVHLMNGLYANILTDRLIGHLSLQK
ncbi:oxidoreductase [Allorhizobium sp. BGMRC 0089]|uniref:proton-conducting transporter transmembrane domain-containing protein n=1 Tax=Allorhizobium sonneratiae TaxID=2934936 RepID=UPI0020348613|nr:proton-conducting transporter membrane subunit [Allorhizobium sonneratiae]MCM2292716.1 oxidoreductase [Allorhizobium sonneratiae]